MAKTPTDPALVKRGSTPAFETTAEFEATVLPLTAYLQRRAYAFTGNTADAEDLVQETLLKAYRGFRPGAGADRIRAWLVCIMRNTWISRYRATVRRPAETLIGDVSDSRFEAAAAGSAEHLVLDEVASQETIGALAALSEPLRLTVFYTAVLQLSCREVSAVMGVPPGTVMSRMFRARLQLRRALHNHPSPDRLHDAQLDEVGDIPRAGRVSG